jgi:hypothetical protein
MPMTRAMLLLLLIAAPNLSRAEESKPIPPDAEEAAVTQALGIAIRHFMENEDAPAAPNQEEWMAAFEAARATSKTLQKGCEWSSSDRAKEANSQALKVLISICTAKNFDEHRELVRDLARNANQKRARFILSGISMAISRLKTDTDSTSDACFARLENLLQTTPPSTPAACAPRTAKGKKPVLCAKQPADEIGMPCWGGPYLKNENDLLDPWKTRVRVTVKQASESSLEVKTASAGPDKKWGTADDIAGEM